MNDVKKSKMKNKGLLVALLLFISLGYALLNANLRINGTSKINDSRWSIYFDNVVVNQNSVALSPGDSAATINQGDTTEVNYAVTLSKPGDFYEFTVDAVNDGTVDAMIDVILSTYKIGEEEATTITSSSLPSYLEYKVSYSDGIAFSQYQELKAGESETYKVRVEYKKDITENDLPINDQSIAFSFSVEYKQADSNVIRVAHPISFENDSWETIINSIKMGNINGIEVGDTKEVDMGTLGTHTLRVANTTTPAECSTEGFSQTACGIVLEFVDSISNKVMIRSYTNAGGWPASKITTYVNNDIYNSLPSVLRNAILDTYVVSGHGYNGTNINYISTDKLYLLSTKEVGFDVSYDTAKAETRILDYYSNNNNNSSRIKKYNNSNGNWWLRTADAFNSGSFYNVGIDGSAVMSDAGGNLGVSPAFRVG